MSGGPFVSPMRSHPYTPRVDRVASFDRKIYVKCGRGIVSSAREGNPVLCTKRRGMNNRLMRRHFQALTELEAAVPETTLESNSTINATGTKTRSVSLNFVTGVRNVSVTIVHCASMAMFSMISRLLSVF